MNLQEMWSKVLIRKELRKQILETEKKLNDLRTAYKGMQKDRMIQYWQRNKEKIDGI